MGRGQVQKHFWNFECRLSISVLEVKPYLFVLNLATFWASFFTFFGPFQAIFWSFGAFFGVGVRLKNIFGTYLCSESTLVLEVQPIFLLLLRPNLGPFSPLGTIFGVEVRFKNIFGTYLHRLTTFILEV